MSSSLFKICEMGDINAFKSFLNNDGNHDNNLLTKRDAHGQSLLHLACKNGNKEIVRMLLERSEYKDVISKNFSGNTPLHLACYKGGEEVVELLLPRLHVHDITTKNNSELTPVHLACTFGSVRNGSGQFKALQMLMPFLKDEDFFTRGSSEETPIDVACANFNFNAVERILAHIKPQYDKEWFRPGMFHGLNMRYYSLSCVSLIEKYKKDPIKTRAYLRKEWELDTKDAAESFSLVVGICDDYFEVKQETWGNDNLTTRFFKITCALPMELQMMICNRLYDCESDIIKAADFDKAIIRNY